MLLVFKIFHFGFFLRVLFTLLNIVNANACDIDLSHKQVMNKKWILFYQHGSSKNTGAVSKLWLYNFCM